MILTKAISRHHRCISGMTLQNKDPGEICTYPTVIIHLITLFLNQFLCPIKIKNHRYSINIQVLLIDSDKNSINYKRDVHDVALVLFSIISTSDGVPNEQGRG
jgi:hypothetical protein